MRSQAELWWSELSINQQKEYSRVALYNYEYSYIWDYSYSKYVKYDMWVKLITKVWSNAIGIYEKSLIS